MSFSLRQLARPVALRLRLTAPTCDNGHLMPFSLRRLARPMASTNAVQLLFVNLFREFAFRRSFLFSALLTFLISVRSSYRSSLDVPPFRSSFSAPPVAHVVDLHTVVRLLETMTYQLLLSSLLLRAVLLLAALFCAMLAAFTLSKAPL